MQVARHGRRGDGPGIDGRRCGRWQRMTRMTGREGPKEQQDEKGPGHPFDYRRFVVSPIGANACSKPTPMPASRRTEVRKHSWLANASRRANECVSQRFKGPAFALSDRPRDRIMSRGPCATDVDTCCAVERPFRRVGLVWKPWGRLRSLVDEMRRWKHSVCLASYGESVSRAGIVRLSGLRCTKEGS